jgi:hypothetical protein
MTIKTTLSIPFTYKLTSSVYILQPTIYHTNILTYLFQRLHYSCHKPWLHRHCSDITIIRFIYKRVYHYLEKNHILDNEQFGFCENTSTDEAIYALLNTVLLSLDKKKYLRRAFLANYIRLLIAWTITFFR